MSDEADVDTLIEAMDAIGFDISQNAAEFLWHEHSETSAATWLCLDGWDLSNCLIKAALRHIENCPEAAKDYDVGKPGLKDGRPDVEGIAARYTSPLSDVKGLIKYIYWLEAELGG